MPELPTTRSQPRLAVGDLDRLELLRAYEARPLEPLRRQLAVGEEALRQRDAAEVQALELQRLEAVADDELGAAAADVDDQPARRLGRQRVRDAGIDQARLLDAGR